MAATASNSRVFPSPWRRTFRLSILMAILVSAPLAAGVVAVRWAAAEPRALLDAAFTPATWSARAYMAAFDILLLVTWPAAAVRISKYVDANG